MRIYRNKYYILEHIPGISGFKQWNHREFTVCNGHHASHNRLQVVGEFLFNGGKFRLNDGHLPDYQPVTGLMSELYAHLDANGQATIETPELYGLKTIVS